MKIYSDNFPYSNGNLSTVAPAAWGVQSGVFDMIVAGAQVTAGSNGSNANVSYYLQPMDTDETVASMTLTANAGSTDPEIIGLAFGQQPGAQADRILVSMGYDGANHNINVRRELIPGGVPDWSNYFFTSNTVGQVIQVVWRYLGGTAYVQVLLNGRPIKKSSWNAQDGSPPTPEITGRMVVSIDTPPGGRYPALSGYGNGGLGVPCPNIRVGDWSSKDVHVAWITDNSVNDFTGEESTYIASDFPTTNFSSSNDLHANDWGGAAAKAQSLLRFQGLSNIPAGSPIVTASVALAMGSNNGIDNNYQIGLYRNNRAWVETEATWNIYSTGNSWTNPGGFGAPDSATVASDSIVIDTAAPTAEYYHWGGAGIIADVQAWVNGTQNNGWIIIKDGGSTNDGALRVFGSDKDTDGFRPILMITYLDASGAETYLRVEGERVLRLNSRSQLLKVIN